MMVSTITNLKLLNVNNWSLKMIFTHAQHFLSNHFRTFSQEVLAEFWTFSSNEIWVLSGGTRSGSSKGRHIVRPLVRLSVGCGRRRTRRQFRRFLDKFLNRMSVIRQLKITILTVGNNVPRFCIILNYFTKF